MNDETLPRDHGYPVRLLAPGHAGCRNVKWVKTISVSAAPSELDSGSKLDRHFSPDITWKDHRIHCDPKKKCYDDEICRVDISKGPVIQTLPVQSVISYPPNYATMSGDVTSIDVKGVAWSGAGRGICRVEVSIDGGNNFVSADLHQDFKDDGAPPPEAGMGRNWAWHQFRKTIPLPEEVKSKLRKGENVQLEIVSKAVDGDFNSQPERMCNTWNVLGICVNHWARQRVTLDPSLRSDSPPSRPKEPSPGSYIWPGKCADTPLWTGSCAVHGKQ